jgi:hypothetical protein
MKAFILSLLIFAPLFCLANSYDDDEAIRRAAQKLVDYDEQQREAARRRADGIDTSSQDNNAKNADGTGVAIFYFVVLAGVGFYFWKRNKGQKHKLQPVPKPISRSYFFSLDGKDSGPYSLEEMRLFRRSGTVSDETLVVRLGDSEWQPASMFAEITFK